MLKLKSVASALDKLNHGLEDRAGKLLNRIEEADTRANNAFGRANSTLDSHEAALNDVDQIIGAIEKATNGGPTLGAEPPAPSHNSSSPPPGVTLNTQGH